MRMVFLCCAILFLPLTSSAQIITCLNPTPQLRGFSKVTLKPTNAFKDVRVAGRSPYEPAFSVSGLNFGGEARTVPGMGVSYVPKSNRAGKIVFSGGFLWSSGSSTARLDPRIARMQRAQSPLWQSTAPHRATAVGIGYFGTEYRYYLLNGEIQPYVGVGARALGGVYATQWGMGVLAHGLAGVNIRISNLFSGFGELQHAPGVGIGVGGFDSFRGLTSFAFGFSFAPQLSSR